jgi:hypothetical protein
MKVHILYVLDKEDSGIGGPFPKMKVFHSDVNPEKIWEYFKENVSDDEFETCLDGCDSEDDLKEVLLEGYDVQGDHTYWNLVRDQEVEG